MPSRGCPRCGAPNCRVHRPKPAPRRTYSDTAEYRAMYDDVLATYGTACHYGDGDATDRPGDPPVLAHVIPHAAGGTFTLDNLRLAHRSCNAGDNRPQEAQHG